MIKCIISIVTKTLLLLVVLAIFLFICLNMSPFDIYVNCGLLIVLGIAIVILLYDIISNFELCYEYKRQKNKEERIK
mgnify:FL=1